MLRKPVPFRCVLCSYSQICFLMFSLFVVFSVCLRQSSKAGKSQRVIQSLNVFCLVFEETKFYFSNKSLSVIFISGAENNYRWRRGWNILTI